MAIVTLVGTDAQRLSSLIVSEYEPALGYTRKTITGATFRPIGTLLTAAGAVVTNATVADLDSISMGVQSNDKLLVIYRGPASIKKSGILWDASFDTDVKKAAVYAALGLKGIDALDAV